MKKICIQCPIYILNRRDWYTISTCIRYKIEKVITNIYSYLIITNINLLTDILEDRKSSLV